MSRTHFERVGASGRDGMVEEGRPRRLGGVLRVLEAGAHGGEAVEMSVDGAGTAAVVSYTVLLSHVARGEANASLL